jgi:hypothetical protein
VHVLVGLLQSDSLVSREVNGLYLKLHTCTPGLVSTSAQSGRYKGTNSPIPSTAPDDDDDNNNNIIQFPFINVGLTEQWPIIEQAYHKYNKNDTDTYKHSPT